MVSGKPEIDFSFTAGQILFEIRSDGTRHECMHRLHANTIMSDSEGGIPRPESGGHPLHIIPRQQRRITGQDDDIVGGGSGKRTGKAGTRALIARPASAWDWRSSGRSRSSRTQP